MSLLTQLFNRGVFGTKCKTCLNLSISRIKLLQNKREMQLKHMRKEIAQFLQAGQEAVARIRVLVSNIWRNLWNRWAAYEILVLFCEFVLARVPIIEGSEDCPPELREAISSIIFSAPRCSEVPDLLLIKTMFTAKYGKEFIAAAAELHPDSGVNRTIIEKLSVSAPSGEARLKVLKEIAQEYNLNWDSSSTETEFSRKHEDLLHVNGGVAPPSRAPTKHVTFSSPPSNGAHSIVPTDNKPEPQYLPSPRSSSNTDISCTNEIQPSITYDIAGSVRETRPQSSDILKKAQLPLPMLNAHLLLPIQLLSLSSHYSA